MTNVLRLGELSRLNDLAIEHANNVSEITKDGLAMPNCSRDVLTGLSRCVASGGHVFALSMFHDPAVFGEDCKLVEVLCSDHVWLREMDET